MKTAGVAPVAESDAPVLVAALVDGSATPSSR